MPHFCVPVGSPSRGSGNGASCGRSCVRITMYKIMNVANINPGTKAIRPNNTTSPPIIPDIAAMITAMMDVTIATPPRTRLSQKSSELYISLAMPERSSKAAIKMNKGTEIKTYSVIKSNIFCVRIYKAPVPGRLVSIVRMPSHSAPGK